MSTQLSQLQMRRGTSAQWATANPILLEGEFGVDTTVDRFKIGDGVTAWASLGWAVTPAPTQVACSDETSALTTGQKAAFRVVGARTLAGVRASLTTAQASGSILTIDVRKNGVSVLSTLITIDNGEKTSVTAAIAAVISVSSFADDDEVTIHITQVGTGGAGLKVSLLWE